MRLRKLPADFAACWDALLQSYVKHLAPAQLWKTYGLPAYGVSVRLLSKTEARTIVKSELRRRHGH